MSRGLRQTRGSQLNKGTWTKEGYKINKKSSADLRFSSKLRGSQMNMSCVFTKERVLYEQVA